MLDSLLPWDFSPTVLALVAIAGTLYLRGARRSSPPVPAARRAAFYAGLVLIYAALQTRWDYYAGHMFFVHRLQHFALHDLGPFLLAWSAPAPVLASGAGERLREWPRAARAALRIPARIVFDPWTATGLFVSSLAFWVWPPVHFDAMLSNWVYTTMNWSVVVLDLPFWWLILDPRPYPESRLRQGARIVMLSAVMLPMILIGAVIGLSRHDLYPVYELCGRIFPLSPVTDQQLGGLIIWIPGSLLAVLAALVALSRLMRQSEAQVLRRRAGRGCAAHPGSGLTLPLSSDGAARRRRS
jgi:putative membrane protein